MPSFRKPVGVIPDGLKKGEYVIHINNSMLYIYIYYYYFSIFLFFSFFSLLAYDLTKNNKYIVFTKCAWFGMKNDGFGMNI